jgi:hypothetical protein
VWNKFKLTAGWSWLHESGNSRGFCSPSVELSFIRRRWIVFRLQFVALVVDLGAAFAGSALSSGLCEHIQRSESRLLQQVTGGVTESMTKPTVNVQDIELDHQMSLSAISFDSIPIKFV